MSQDVVKSYLKGMAAAKHPRLWGNIWRDRHYGRYSCAMMWITIRNIVLIQYCNNNNNKKKIVSGAILNLESLVEAVENLTVCWSRSRRGYVHWRWSCELILQSVVTHVLSINKERQELSHDNGGVCFECFFFPWGNLLFTLCIVLKSASAQSNCQYQVTTMWQ